MTVAVFEGLVEFAREKSCWESNIILIGFIGSEDLKLEVAQEIFKYDPHNWRTHSSTIGP